MSRLIELAKKAGRRELGMKRNIKYVISVIFALAVMSACVAQ